MMKANYFQYKVMILCITCLILFTFASCTNDNGLVNVPINYETEPVNDLPTRISPTKIYNQYIVPTCKNFGEHQYILEQTGLVGEIYFQGFDFRGLYKFSEIPVNLSEIVSDQQLIFLGFSPNKQWMAYIPVDSTIATKVEDIELVLISSKGEKIEYRVSIKEFENELQVEHVFLGVTTNSYWITDELIYITLYSQNPDPNTSGAITEYVKILNPFSGEWQNQYLDLPGRNSSNILRISPDTRQVLFEEGGLSLWNYSQNKKIWHDGNIDGLINTIIKWNFDGTMVAVASITDSLHEQSVTLVTKDGDSSFIYSRPYPILGQIKSISWSPNNRYLSIAIIDNSDLSILIYDVINQEYVIQCPVIIGNSDWISMAWSPDNSQIAFSTIDSPIIIYDLDSQNVIELDVIGRVLGWK